MLYLLVRLANDAYAIEAGCVRRIVPFARLKPFPCNLPEVAGVLNFHGSAVPVLDLTLLLAGAPSREHIGTRIVLADVGLPGGDSRLLGLLTEGATSVARFDDFQPAGIRPDGRPWLGPVAEHDHLFVQRIEIGSLLPPAVLDALVRDSESALAA
jgi:chemotaxis-related protein WspB